MEQGNKDNDKKIEETDKEKALAVEQGVKVIRRYGWKRDLPDIRDLRHTFTLAAVNLPVKVDLRNFCPPVYDQGNLGSCTANAISAAYQFDQIKAKLTTFMPSRLFVYYNERVIEHTVNIDSGASIRDSAKTINKTGVCKELDWPYIIAKFAVKPPVNCYTDAKTHRSIEYRAVSQTLNDLKSCLASGFPFVFGFSVYDSFESADVARTGKVPMPALTETFLGGHAVMCVGYDEATKYFIVRNSWGSGWGDKGYCYMPYAYLTNWNLAGDFWTVTKITKSV